MSDNKQVTKERIAIMQAYVDGEKIEAYWHGHWYEISEFENWNWEENDYRIKPIPAPIPMTIPWDVIKPEYMWAAMDECGDVYIYSHKPQQLTNNWWLVDSEASDEPSMMSALDILVIDKGTVDWKDSLVERTY